MSDPACLPPVLGFPLMISANAKRNVAAPSANVWRKYRLATLLLFAVLMGGLQQAQGQGQPGQSEQETGNSQAVASQPVQPGPVHIVPFGRNGSAIKNTAAPVGAHLTYWGGPVISQVHVVAVFWGSNVNTAITAPGAIDQFFRDITNSRYYDLLTEYSTVGVTGAGVPAASSNQSINRGVFDVAFTIVPSTCNITPPATCTIDDTVIQAELKAQINAGHLPQPVTDTQGNLESFYMIYFPPGASITAGGITSCVTGGFCAYHSSTQGTLAPTLVPYGVQPDFAPPSGCSTGCGAGTLFQQVTAVTSHELSEAVTDAQVGSANSTAPPLAWYDPDPAANPLGEIGDICGGQDVLVNAGLNTYSVQQEFSNLQNDCVSAPPSFSLNPPATVAPGVSFNIPLTIQSSAGGFTLSGYTGTVHFTSSDPAAVLPTDYTFTATDGGTHTFAITLSTLGNQAVTVTDTHSAGFTGTATTNVNTIPDLVISKTHAGNFTAGQTGSYTITVSNSGNGPTTAAVTVTDTLPSGLTATAISGTGWTCDLPTLTCSRADALAHGSSYPAITLAVSVAANAPSSVANFVTVSGGGETNLSNDSAIDVTTIVLPPAPDLAIFKSHNGPINGNFFQGETGAVYAILVKNAGSLPTTGTVTVIDTLPVVLTPTAISGTGWNCDLATLTCTRSDALAAGASYPTITLTANVASNAPAIVNNTATVSGGGDNNTTNNVVVDTTIIQPPPAPDLAISMGSVPFPFVEGLVGATYIIAVNNVGTASSSGTVTVTDILGSGQTATAMSGTGWLCNLAALSCARSDALANGSSYPLITLTINIGAGTAPTVTNTVSVTGGGDNNATNNSATVITPVNVAPDLTVSLTHNGVFTQGQVGAVYTLTVTNLAGSGTTSGPVTVTDQLPAGLTATAMSGAGWTCVLNALSCTQILGLPGGSSYAPITLVVNVSPNSPLSMTNTATVSGGGDLNTANNTATDVTTIPISIISANSSASTIAGQSANFIFTVSSQPAVGTVTLSCSGLPVASGCSFNPGSVNQTPAQVTMTVTTTARAGSLPVRSLRPWGSSKFLLLIAIAVLIRAIATARHRLPRLRPAPVLVGMLALAVLAGCGGKSSTAVPQPVSGTPAGTYSVTITASGTNATATQVVSLTVR